MNHRIAGPVLVVHRDEGIRDVITGALDLEGIAARSAAPEDAVAALGGLQPGLVLLDFDDGGGSVLREALERGRAGAVPIVGLTTRPSPSQVPPAGAAAELPMPFDLDDLVGTVGQFCRAS